MGSAGTLCMSVRLVKLAVAPASASESLAALSGRSIGCRLRSVQGHERGVPRLQRPELQRRQLGGRAWGVASPVHSPVSTCLVSEVSQSGTVTIRVQSPSSMEATFASPCSVQRVEGSAGISLGILPPTL